MAELSGPSTKQRELIITHNVLSKCCKTFRFSTLFCVFDFFCTCNFAKSYQTFHNTSHSYYIISNLSNHNSRQVSFRARLTSFFFFKKKFNKVTSRIDRPHHCANRTSEFVKLTNSLTPTHTHTDTHKIFNFTTRNTSEIQ